MSRSTLLPLLLTLAATGCAKQMPRADLSLLEPAVRGRCEARGAMVVLDERFEDYRARNYDTFKVGRLRQAGTTASVTVPDPMRRLVLRIFTREGANQASTFGVIHLREQLPPVEVRAWTAAGRERKIQVNAQGTRSMVNWPCRSGHPRVTTFRIGPVNPGDTIEIIHPLSGPLQEIWKFAHPRWCTLRSVATFGHPHDTAATNLPMDGVIYDQTGAVERTSEADDHPKVYALTRPLEPLPAGRIPMLVRSRRCRGWKYLHGKVFHTPIWMARDGSLPRGENGVPAGLLEPAPGSGHAERIRRVAAWLAGIPVEEREVSFWMRWLPQEPGWKVAEQGKGSRGGQAALAFRLLEEAGLAPRLALLHTHDRIPFTPDFASPLQFDTLGVVVADETGTDHWLVPGLASDRPVPPAIQGRKALVMKRWVAERITGGGACWPEFEVLWSCYNAAKALDAMDLITVGR